MSNKSFQVIVALFDTWHQHERNFYIETTLKNNMYCKHSHCSMKQTFMKICIWLKIVKISKCTIKRPHCSIWLKFASIGLLWMSQEATSTFGKCNQWVLEQHPLYFGGKAIRKYPFLENTGPSEQLQEDDYFGSGLDVSYWR